MALKFKIRSGVLAGFFCFGGCVAMLCVADSAVAQQKGKLKPGLPVQEQENEGNGYEAIPAELAEKLLGKKLTPQQLEDPKQTQELLRKAFGPITTAEALLTRLDSKQMWNPRELELSEEEANKAVAALRSRYPFQSLRDRLDFHPDLAASPESPSSVTKPVDGRAVKKWTPGDLKQGIAKKKIKNSLVGASTREGALRQLHSEEAVEFVNRENNGFSRMRSITPYNLPLDGRYAARLDSRPVDSDLLGEPLVELQSVKPQGKYRPSEQDWSRQLSLTKNGMPSKELAQNFHGYASNNFANAYTTGYFKSIDEVAGFEPHRTRFAENWFPSLKLNTPEQLKRRGNVKGLEIDWKVNRLQLVSLLLFDEPRVYNEENLPNMEELSGADIATRALDAFEQEALEKLQAGEDIVTRATPNRILMLGSMRATKDCMKCHAVKDKELLGAFSYEFLRDPKLNLKKVEF